MDPVQIRKTPCCGYTWTTADETPVGPIYWNPLSNVVQCHNCGEGFYSTTMYRSDLEAAGISLQQWRPISEAPKDGTVVVVTHWPANGKPPLQAVRWCRGPQKSGARWRLSGNERTPLRYEPTHYTIPAPPKE